MSEKVCTGCKLNLPLVDYFIVGSGRRVGKPFPKCRKCEAKRAKKYRNRNKGKLRYYQIKTNFNLSKDRFDKLVSKQNNLCSICKHYLNSPYVDHDHSCCKGSKSCGKCVRGLLCRDCNSGLGFFKDSITILQNAISYLENNVSTK